ncbi:hypothetical protein, partial [Pseudomonas aeruginosa]
MHNLNSRGIPSKCSAVFLVRFAAMPLKKLLNRSALSPFPAFSKFWTKGCCPPFQFCSGQPIPDSGLSFSSATA